MVQMLLHVRPKHWAKVTIFGNYMAADSTMAVLRHEVDSSWLLFLTSATSNILLYNMMILQRADVFLMLLMFLVFTVHNGNTVDF
jgi:hypothetical protein